MPERPHAVANGAYLFLALHLLFLLTVVWQSVVAAGLLFSFFILSSLQPVAWDVLEEGQQQYLNAELVAVEPSTADVGGKEKEGGTQAFVSAVYPTHESPATDGCRASRYHCTPSPPREVCGSVEVRSSVKSYGGLASQGMGPPSTTRECEPCRDADISVKLCSPVRDGADDTLIYVASALDRPSTERPIAESVRIQADECNAQVEVTHGRRGASGPQPQMHAHSFHSIPRSSWVLATAVITLATVCASGALFGLLYVSEDVDPSSGSSVLPGWATTSAAEALLIVLVGVQVDSSNSKWRFCASTACLSVVSVASWCLLLRRALGRCSQEPRNAASLVMADSRVKGSSTLSNVRVGWNTVLRRLGGFVTSAPYSLVWVGVAGAGQETALGLLSLTVVMVMVLLLSSHIGQVRRQRESDRRQWWGALYTCMLLCLWEVQMVVLLPRVQHSLKAASVWARYGRWLTAVGAVPAASHSSMLRWRIVQAIGLWWAGTEFVCCHTATRSTSPLARFSGGRKQRALLVRGLARRDEIQRSCVIYQHRAAHRKLQQLRLERGAYLFQPHQASSDDRRQRARAPQSHGASWCGEQRYTQRDGPQIRGHEPFGNSSLSHCCWLGRDGQQHLPIYVCSGHSNEHECQPTLLRHDPAPSGTARVRGANTGWPTEAAGSSPPYSHSSVYGCLSGRRAPWQYSEIASTQPSAESESAVVLITATAAVLLSESAAEPLKSYDPEAKPSRYMWQGLARESTRSPCRGPVEVNGNDADVGYSSCGAYNNGEHRARRGGSAWSTSGVHSPYSFSVATSGPRAGHSKLCGATNKNLSPRPSGSGGCRSNARWPSMVHGTPVDASAVDCASSFGEGGVHRCLSLSREDPGHPEEVRAEHIGMSGAMSGAEEEIQVADACPPMSSLPVRLRGRIRLATHKVSELLRDHLQRHTVSLPAELENSADECPAAPQTGAAHSHRQRRCQTTEEGAERLQQAFGSSAPSRAAEGAAPPLDIHVDAPHSSTSCREIGQASSLWRLLELYVMQYWSYLCALLMLIQFAVCGTVVNLVPSFASTVYALLQRPWPSLWYWRLQLLFSALAFLVKSTARVYLLAMVPSASPTICRWVNLLLLRVDVDAPSALVASLPSLPPSSMFGSEFYRYMWVDLAVSGSVLAAVAIQWAVVFPDHCVFWGRESREGERDATASRPAVVLASSEPTDPPAREAHRKTPHRSPVKLWRICTRHLRRWNTHRCGAGADYYVAQLFFDGLSLALFAWAYYAIVPEDTANSEGNLLHAVKQNQLPGIFVATALGLVVVLVLERILYVLQALVAKYLLHCLLAAVYHALYVVWLTSQESKRGSGATSSVITTASVSLLLSAKLASLWCSALQLRHGYELYRQHDAFTIKTDMLHWLGHATFRAVPFLMELRVLLDWSFSATTLKVQHWMLLEDIHHTVYRRYVDMRDLHYTSRHLGRRFPHLVRLYQGVFGFTVILSLLFFPLFWYSTFSPQVRANHVTAWTTEMAFAGMSSVPLFSADATVRPSSFREAATLSFGGAAVKADSLLRFAAVTDTWQTAHLASCSSRMWPYTPAALQELVDRLGRRSGVVNLLVRNRVTRDRASEAKMTAVELEESYALPPASQAILADALKAWREADYADSASMTKYAASALGPVVVPLPFLYSPYVLNYGTGVSFLPGVATREASCVLTLHRVGQYRGFSCVQCTEGNQSSPATSTLAAGMAPGPAASSQVESASVPDETSASLAFVVVSNNVATVQSSFSLIPSVGIIALYTSFVLVMSSYIRNYFAGDAHRVVLLQLANPEPVAELLRYLYLARSSANDGQVDDLALEQLLFMELLDLLRSPERLLRLGGRRVDDYVAATYRQALYDATRRPFALPREEGS
ncbi:hypothetical protein JIQ42_01478 [Leishmania sp. Namibia]|uniref:hypothetical protein n=1 Tax=Leishmania sp. Namibia TaxID=2802991 RepID=UPI001B6AE5A1|nr:hypothetical protein JIQ42_01478 [Leishmania sp. Namibia]